MDAAPEPEWVVYGAKQGETYTQRHVIFGPYKIKKLADDIAVGLKANSTFRWIEVRLKSD